MPMCTSRRYIYTYTPERAEYSVLCYACNSCHIPSYVCPAQVPTFVTNQYTQAPPHLMDEAEHAA